MECFIAEKSDTIKAGSVRWLITLAFNRTLEDSSRNSNAGPAGRWLLDYDERNRGSLKVCSKGQ